MTIAPDASVRVETDPITTDPRHAAALADLTTIVDKIRYACEHGPGPRTDAVRQWLDAYGVTTKRPYTSTVVTGFRKARGLSDTGDLPALTPAVLAELDTLTPDNVAEPEPTPVAASPAERSAEAPAAPALPDPTPAPVPAPLATAQPVTAPARPRRTVRTWPVLLLALPAFVAIWSGWVGLGELAGFGIVHPLPGIWDSAQLNTAITLPVGVETYAAYALHVWLSGRVRRQARTFAKWSAIGSLLLGMAGQGAYHLMISQGMTHAPWLIVTLVSCLPVAVLGMGAALAHLVRGNDHDDD